MYDLIIKNARTLDHQPIEIGIESGKISALSTEIIAESREIFDAKGQFISAGWIDAHVHCYENMSLYYDYPDEVGVKNGVTTIVDAGSTGENNIREFYELTKKSKTNVYALLNISRDGIVHQDELADLSKVDETKNLERIKELSEFIIGIKARMSKSVIGQNGHGKGASKKGAFTTHGAYWNSTRCLRRVDDLSRIMRYCHTLF